MNKDDELHGNEAGLARLYAEQRLKLKARFSRLCPQERDKEDLVQETFLRLAKRVRDPSQRAIQDPARLLFSIASAVLVDHLRRVGPRTRRGARKAAFESLHGTAVPDPSPPLEESLHREQSIRHTLAGLPIEQRRAIQLQLTGLERDQIARQLGVSVAAVRRLLWAAYGRVRRNALRAEQDCE